MATVTITFSGPEILPTFDSDGNLNGYTIGANTVNHTAQVDIISAATMALRSARLSGWTQGSGIPFGIPAIIATGNFWNSEVDAESRFQADLIHSNQLASTIDSFKGTGVQSLT
jgi:hypothetical protein